MDITAAIFLLLNLYSAVELYEFHILKIEKKSFSQEMQFVVYIEVIPLCSRSAKWSLFCNRGVTLLEQNISQDFCCKYS